MQEINFGADGDYSEERFIDIVNANLANTIGNMLNRTLNLLKKNCDGYVSLQSRSHAVTRSRGHVIRVTVM